MGHCLNGTVQDLLTRWRRMQGQEALWMPGTDHAGIATQAVVERRMLEEEGLTRHDIGREALVEAVKRVKLMARELNTSVRLSMSDDGLELVAITQDVGQASEQLDAAYEGSDLTVAFNPDYLLSGIEVTPGDEILLDTVDAQKPAVIRAGDAQEFLYLLMPVRVP